MSNIVYYPWMFFNGNVSIASETTTNQYGTTSGNSSDSNTIPDILNSKFAHSASYPTSGIVYACPDENNALYGEEGRYLACSRDLEIDGWAGADQYAWNTYSGDGTDNGLSDTWDGSFDSMSGCVFKGTNYDPAGIPNNLTAATCTTGCDRRVGHDYWRSFFSNYNLIEQETGGSFDYEAIAYGMEPHSGDAYTSYRVWRRDYAPAGDATNNWPDHIEWIAAVDTKKKLPSGSKQRGQLYNKIYLFAKFESGFNGEGANSDLVQSALENGYVYDSGGVDRVLLNFQINLNLEPQFVRADNFYSGIENY